MNKFIRWGLISFLVVSLTFMSIPAQAQIPHKSNHERFPYIEQPLGLKVGVGVGGLLLIGLELWWFLRSNKSDVQEVMITVEKGYQPAIVKVHPGKLVKLKFFRKDPSSCLDEVVFPAFNINSELTLNQITCIEFTPRKEGKYEFTCGRKVFRGVVEVMI